MAELLVQIMLPLKHGMSGAHSPAACLGRQGAPRIKRAAELQGATAGSAAGALEACPR